jgi:hypothetical protein
MWFVEKVVEELRGIQSQKWSNGHVMSVNKSQRGLMLGRKARDYHVGRGYSTIHEISSDFQARLDYARAKDQHISPEDPLWQQPQAL